MANLSGMTQRESDICKGYWEQIQDSRDWDRDQAALDATRTRLGAGASPAALSFVERSQEHIDALRKVTRR